MVTRGSLYCSVGYWDLPAFDEPTLGNLANIDSFGPSPDLVVKMINAKDKLWVGIQNQPIQDKQDGVYRLIRTSTSHRV
jgi:hypothetical protein